MDLIVPPETVAERVVETGALTIRGVSEPRRERTEGEKGQESARGAVGHSGGALLGLRRCNEGTRFTGAETSTVGELWSCD